ncbi:MAG: MlaD family protein [Prevotella sp.]|nr:MlaD family protein [Prevotella sp.]
MKEFFTKEIRIALTVIIGIVVLFVGMNFLKGIIVFSNDNSYKVVMRDINGLSASSPVYANGFQVGVVRNILYDYEGVNGGIIVTIDADNKMRIPVGTTAEVSSDLMGNLKLNLILSDNMRESIEPGGVIIGSLGKGMMDEVAQMMPQLKALLPKLDSILTNVNIIMSDPALKSIIDNVNGATDNLNKSSAQLNKMMTQFESTMPGMLQKVDAVLGNTEQITSDIAKADIATTMKNISATLQNCRELTDKLNSNEGSLGKFINDPSLYDNLNATMRDADSLMIDLKSHPKRYVHFSIFGRKDK